MSAIAITPVSVGNWRRFTEIVEARHGRGRYTILLREDPLYQQGDAPARHKHRYAHLVSAPNVPMYQGGLGSGPALLATAGGIAAKGASSIATSLGVASSIAGPIGLGVGLAISLIASFWSAHEARKKGATTENAAVSSAVQAFDQTMHAIFDAANSSDPAKNISASQAITLCNNAYTQFWNGVCSYTQGPGRSDVSNCGTNCGGPTNMAAPCAGMPNGHFCNKQCTVSCCVGCQDIKPSVDQAVALFQAGQAGSITVCGVASSKYGLGARGAYTLSWTPPTPTLPASSATGAITSLFGGSGGSSSPLLWTGLALAAFLVLK